MIKVLVAALVGTIIGIVVMVAVIALSGTDTSGASSVGIGTLPLSTFSPSTPTSAPPATGGSTGGGTSSGGSSGNAANGKALFTSKTCSSCHSVTPGQTSPLPAAPNLADLNSQGTLTQAVILHQIQSPAPPMPAGLASGQDATDLAAYILSLGK
jgi:cytochrome c553